MTHEAPDESHEWTPGERAALDALTREAEPDAGLEERTVRALRRRGLLEPSDALGAWTPGRNGAEGRGSRAAWWAAGLAASLALFLSGTLVGQWRAEAAARDTLTALRVADAHERAALVQQTGSLYVEALAGLADLQASGQAEEEVATGTEVARAALHAAAIELARLHPDDARYARILEALEPPAGAGETKQVRQVLWF